MRYEMRESGKSPVVVRFAKDSKNKYLVRGFSRYERLAGSAILVLSATN